MLRDIYVGSCKYVGENFAGLFKGIELEWDKELEESIKFTRLGVTPHQVVVFAWFSGLLMFTASLFLGLVALFAGINPLQVLVLGLFAACATVYFIQSYPVQSVIYEKMNCLAYAPHLIAYLIITLKQDPNLEKAVKFASENGTDRMSEDLRQLLWHTWAGKYSSIGEALPILGYTWGAHVKGFRDALYAIRASQVEKHEFRRVATLDRALKDMLINIQAKFREFINDLRTPTMVLFMAGVMIPMVVVMFMPVFYMLGLDIGTPAWVTFILVLIIMAVFFLAEYILSRRPVAFSPIMVPDNHPDLPHPGRMRIGQREVSLKKFSLWVFLLLSLGSAPYLLGHGTGIFAQLNTLPIVVGVFSGMWVYFYFDSAPRMRIRNQIEQAEEDCVEACFHIGNRLMSGMPAEEALIKVSEMLEDPKKESLIPKVLEETVRNIRYMNMSMRSALFDPDKGSLKDVHSGLIRGLFKMFANSMDRGVDAAAETLINSATHFREIRRVEHSLRDKISYTTSMMKVSATMIAPALCAISIPLTEVFIKVLRKVNTEKSLGDHGMYTGMLRTPQITPEMLTILLGLYVLSLLLILTRFTTVLEYGNDSVRTKVEIASAIPKALISFIVVLFACRMFFANIL